MILSNRAFDALLFGALLLAALLDSTIAATAGVASLVAVGGATYWAAQELSDWLLRRFGWTQESLATATALCTGGFFYYAFRNPSDLALLGLSLGLVMGALMVAISVLAALGAIVREGSVAPLLGLTLTVVFATFLGVAAGVLATALGEAGMASAPLKVVALLAALLIWKLRERLSPLAANPHAVPTSGTGVTTSLHARRASPVPQRGTLIDRFVPLLLGGSVLMLLLHQGDAPRLDTSVSADSMPARGLTNATAGERP